ncbi:MAG: LruC domain-containing protein [Pedobacter sp.]|nr:MAG: LruC domain-containing protein [Pedobacter sp.]
MKKNLPLALIIFGFAVFCNSCKKDGIVKSDIADESLKQTMAGPVTINSAGPNVLKTFTTVQINGTNFDPLKANNLVKFNGVASNVLLATPTMLIVNTPIGATTGKVTVTTNNITATSPANIKIVQPVKVASIPQPAIGRVRHLAASTNGTIYGLAGNKIFRYADAALQNVYTTPAPAPLESYTLSRMVTDKNNNVVYVKADYSLIASGGSYQNAAAIQFNLPAGSISNFNDYKVAGRANAPVIESGHDSLVVVLFSNSRQEQVTWNTIKAESKSPVLDYSFSFNVTNGPKFGTLGADNFNLFIWNNSPGFGRGYETHLVGKNPSKKANSALFGTGDDASNPANKKYYSTANNLPWAITIPTNLFKYPVERAPITDAYLKFANWASTGGTQSADWFSNEGSGYRVTNNIY